LTTDHHYEISRQLRNAIRRSPLNQTALAASCGMSQSQISTLLTGRIFGVRARERVFALGRALGLHADVCVREVRK
jgi:hypothetical protein